MRQTLKSIIRNVKSIKGNSLAEFATTTALMATLAATAAPKLSEMSEGTKAEKSKNEIDKILTQARNHYQDTADNEGRGRFPGQEKFNVPVGGYGVERGTQDEAYSAQTTYLQKWAIGQMMIVIQALSGVQYLVTNQPQTEVKSLMMA